MRKERPHVVNCNRFKAEFCLCSGVCVQSNIFVARVLHFSAFIIIQAMWIPRRIKDMDRFANHIACYGTDLDPNHPVRMFVYNCV